ncbi:hypothetical protein ACRAWG_14920 [Methylobacterium sp. P31]
MSDLSQVHAPMSAHPALTATYRAFLLARNGRIAEMVPLQAESEEEARLQALDLIGEEDVVELWSGLQAVARFERPTTAR